MANIVGDLNINNGNLNIGTGTTTDNTLENIIVRAEDGTIKLRDISTLNPPYVQTGQTTTDAELTLVGTNPSKPVTINTMLRFTTKLSAIDSVGDVWCREYKGAIKNIAGVSTIVGTVTEESITEDVGASAWSAIIIANDTIGLTDLLDIKVTGEAAHTINWRAETVFSEVAIP